MVRKGEKRGERGLAIEEQEEMRFDERSREQHRQITSEELGFGETTLDEGDTYQKWSNAIS